MFFFRFYMTKPVQTQSSNLSFKKKNVKNFDLLRIVFSIDMGIPNLPIVKIHFMITFDFQNICKNCEQKNVWLTLFYK